MTIKAKLREAFPFLKDEDFSHHASDLYVLAYPGIYEWLKKNHPFPMNINFFSGIGEWQGKLAIEIPFAIE